MTRKDYELIAHVIRNEMTTGSARAEAALAFADTLHQHNTRFDGDRFIRACMRPGEKITDYYPIMHIEF